MLLLLVQSVVRKVCERDRFVRAIRRRVVVQTKERCPWLVVSTKEGEKRCEHPLNCKERRKKEGTDGGIEN